MELGFVGLGKMGSNMTMRLVRGKHRVVGYDVDLAATEAARKTGVIATRSLEEMVSMLAPPRTVWVMVTAGTVTENTLFSLAKILSSGDTLVDGGNSYYKDTQRRSIVLKERNVNLVDVGTSGGVWGLTEGYSMMIGGERSTVEKLKPLFETLAPAPDKGWGFVGPSGAGHFVKMIHNGIEYGLMQAYAEGFDLMSRKKEFDLDLPLISEIWLHGSVVRSWLLELTHLALKENPMMEGIAPFVPDSGEGRWTVSEAIQIGCPLPVISMAVNDRFRSQDESRFADKLLALLRHQFGGHKVKREEVVPVQ
jgi:6-phosphogluconate dehydrogenase